MLVYSCCFSYKGGRDIRSTRALEFKTHAAICVCIQNCGICQDAKIRFSLFPSKNPKFNSISDTKYWYTMRCCSQALCVCPTLSVLILSLSLWVSVFISLPQYYSLHFCLILCLSFSLCCVTEIPLHPMTVCVCVLLCGYWKD